MAPDERERRIQWVVRKLAAGGISVSYDAVARAVDEAAAKSAAEPSQERGE